MSQNKHKQPRRWLARAGMMLSSMAAGAVIGVLTASNLVPLAEAGVPFGEYLLALGWLLAALLLAVGVQTILHEAGHLVFGLATGYRFSSFRIGSWMLLRQGGQLRVRRMKLAGTAGQCLLEPPPLVDGRIPYVLYNLGGVLMNLVAVALFLALALLCDGVWALSVLFQMLCGVGAADALLNGIPMQNGTIQNDGYNVWMLGKNPAALRALWVQLAVNARQAQGQRLREMPDEWFTLPEEDGLHNSLITAVAVMAESRSMDAQDFAEAARLCDWLDDPQKAVVGLYRGMLLCDRLTCALLTGEPCEALLARWDAKEQRAFRKQMKDYLTVMRTEYAVALLHARDTARAEAVAAQLERRAVSYPYASDLASERELMELARQAAQALPAQE